MKKDKFQPFPPNTILNNRYRIIELIKAGGMGAAYKAADLLLPEKIWAIKQMLDTFKDAEEKQIAIRNFIAELQVLKELIHPNIPRVTDHFLEKNSFFFVMEYIAGVDLSTLLNINQRIGFPYQDVIRWGIQVLDILEYIHNIKPKPIVHRDIKSSNLLRRSADESIMLIDFGIARVATPKEGMMIGTLGYAPPEQYENYVEPRSDIYSLGATMYELLTGIRPEPYCFDFAPEQLSYRGVPQELISIIMKALSYYIEDRFATAEEMKEHLKNLLGETAWKQPQPEFDFLLASKNFRKQHLIPILKQTASNYGNECQTQFMPPDFDCFQFTLGDISPFHLIITFDPCKKKVFFWEKHGLLEKKQLGILDPLENEEWSKADKYIDQFIEHYEASKGILL